MNDQSFSRFGDNIHPVPNYIATPSRDEWESLRDLPSEVRRLFRPRAPLVRFFRNDLATRAIDRLRTRLLHTLCINGWNRVAVAAPTHGCGSTFTAVTLAQSMARISGSRTVLMDVNHRTPGVAGMLDIDFAGDMRGYLEGNVRQDQHLMRASKTLALGLTEGPDPYAAEILHDPQSTRTLNRMTESLQPDVVLFDLPPVLIYDDLEAFLPQVDGVLLVADATQTTADHLKTCARMLEGKTQMLGVLMNRARKSELREHVK